jgi:hypothetical protein
LGRRFGGAKQLHGRAQLRASLVVSWRRAPADREGEGGMRRRPAGVLELFFLSGWLGWDDRTVSADYGRALCSPHLSFRSECRSRHKTRHCGHGSMPCEDFFGLVDRRQNPSLCQHLHVGRRASA